MQLCIVSPTQPSTNQVHQYKATSCSNGLKVHRTMQLKQRCKWICDNGNSPSKTTSTACTACGQRKAHITYFNGQPAANTANGRQEKQFLPGNHTRDTTNTQLPTVKTKGWCSASTVLHSLATHSLLKCEWKCHRNGVCVYVRWKLWKGTQFSGMCHWRGPGEKQAKMAASRKRKLHYCGFCSPLSKWIPERWTHTHSYTTHMPEGGTSYYGAGWPSGIGTSDG